MRAKALNNQQTKEAIEKLENTDYGKTFLENLPEIISAVKPSEATLQSLGEGVVKLHWGIKMNQLYFSAGQVAIAVAGIIVVSCAVVGVVSILYRVLSK